MTEFTKYNGEGNPFEFRTRLEIITKDGIQTLIDSDECYWGLPNALIGVDEYRVVSDTFMGNSHFSG